MFLATYRVSKETACRPAIKCRLPEKNLTNHILCSLHFALSQRSAFYVSSNKREEKRRCILSRSKGPLRRKQFKKQQQCILFKIHKLTIFYALTNSYSANQGMTKFISKGVIKLHIKKKGKKDNNSRKKNPSPKLKHRGFVIRKKKTKITMEVHITYQVNF